MRQTNVHRPGLRLFTRFLAGCPIGRSIPRKKLSREIRLCGRWAVAAFALLGLSGCSQFIYRVNNQVPETFIPNPVELPAAEDNLVWSQVVDAVDDYFRIVRETPVQNNNTLILDGRLETSYRVGASIFEPWRKDSTSGFERLQSTLQSIRRRAIVVVRPQVSGLPLDGIGSPNGIGSVLPLARGGYVLEVIVQKDLEDTNGSQFATESSSAIRHDGTIIRRGSSINDAPQTLGWIPLGRDTSLEQVILQDIFSRITQPDTL